jgi:uncharacterized damage-inducible protein DinB
LPTPKGCTVTAMDTSLPLMYEWVKRSREVLFEYTDALPPAVYLREHPDFAYGSIRNIHGHVAGCYLSWIARYGLGLAQHQQRFEPATVANATAMRQVFSEIDTIMQQAFASFDQLDQVFTLVRPGRDVLQVTQRWLVMHPITHEFHHKGQLLALGRLLGHPLPDHLDTDLVLPVATTLG